MNNLWFFFGVIFMLICSCEKVIDIPLDVADERLVVEAVIKDSPGNNYILLSKSGSVYGGSDLEKVEDAIVTVTDEDGVVFDFPHQEDGLYNSPIFQVVPGKRYDLQVSALGRVITASCQTRSKPHLDSLTYLPITGAFGVPVGDTIHLVSFHSVDDVDEKKFYWVKIFRNRKENSGYYLGNDDFVNGQYYEAQFFGSEADPRDTVFVEMISMDEANYDYFIGLANNLSSGPFAAAPANPPSNLEGDAIGFFGAYTTDTLSLILP